MTTILASATSFSDAPPFALTTIFTPPCGCVSKPARLYGTTIPTTPLEYDWGGTCSTWQLCDPVEYITKVCYSDNGWVYSFSPGVCPQNWAAVATTTSMDGQDVVTSAWCCPDGFTIDTNNEYDCLTHVTTSTAAIHITTSELSCGDVLYIPAGTTTLTDFILHTWFYTVAWRSSDLPHFTPASAPLSMLKGSSHIERSECPAQDYPTTYFTVETAHIGSCGTTASVSFKPSTARFGATPTITGDTNANVPTATTPPDAATFGAAAPTSSSHSAAIRSRFRPKMGFTIAFLLISFFTIY
ncbi:hypothetical protein TWF694_005248 [Orbilia ellipsospora]|uniref:Uncharacterized protein n=1 Tax=Orbilia ellipsospora TaxID=2528407 RepID=A0AAV9WSJ6_9PEZI